MHVTNDEGTLVNTEPHSRDATKEHPISTELLSRSSSTVDAPLLGEQALAPDYASRRDPASPGEQISAALSALLASLATVRQAASPAATLDCAPRALATSAVFQRVMFSRVNGSTWLPEAVYGVDGERRVNVHIESHDGDRVDGLQISLTSPLVEAEVVRRRLPALILDAPAETRVNRILVERMQVSEYVVAPIVTGSTVIGLIHADRPTDGRPLTAAHRDLLRMFADAVGLSYEKALLVERIERQRQYVLDVCDAAMGSIAGTNLVRPIALRADTALPAVRKAPEPTAVPGVRHTKMSQVAQGRESSRLGTLTSREREVLGLLASGATNAQLADQLTVAESTVKSHVKHILHKLGASNRAAVISFYLRETRGASRSCR
ncbi:GAF domain-containing protein [Mycolicibacterium boenickei]|nr:GAF domain-containing protein [Mycolicibacterium boenickei]